MITDDVLRGIRPTDPDEVRQIKLRLPLDQVMKLHRLRILKSAPISQFVADALENYFAEQRAQRAETVAVTQ